MNFNYSYRAFLITSLLTGCLVLFLYSMKLSKERVETTQETYDVEMASEELFPEEKEIAALAPEKVKIETNRAYNEAEKFISSVENERSEERRVGSEGRARWARSQERRLMRGAE